MFGRKFRHLNRMQIKEIQRSGWIIGSHTVSHSSLIGMTRKRIIIELSDSKKNLEDLTGEKIDWISFPFGRYNSEILNLAKECGYHGAIVSIKNNAYKPSNFSLIHATAVYYWDKDKAPINLLQNYKVLGLNRIVRRTINWFSNGTILLKKHFPDKNIMKNFL